MRKTFRKRIDLRDKNYLFKQKLRMAIEKYGPLRYWRAYKKWESKLWLKH